MVSSVAWRSFHPIGQDSPALSDYNQGMYPRRLRFATLFLLLSLLACNLPPTATPPGLPPAVSTAVQQTLIASAPTQSSPVILTPTGVPTVPAVQWPPRPHPGGPFAYLTQSGDTLSALQARFDGLPPSLPPNLPATGPLPAGLSLSFLTSPAAPYADAVLPDSELVYSRFAAGFDVAAYVSDAGGYLSGYREAVKGETLSGAEIVQRVAHDNSLNPRLLLGLLDYQAGWVHSAQPTRPAETVMGFAVPGAEGLYWQLVLTARYLSLGYYGWRDGSLHQLEFLDGSPVALAAPLNPGSVGLQTLFAQLYNRLDFERALYGETGFPAFYAARFGDPWLRANAQFPNDFTQPVWELPWTAGEGWYFTAGPHIAWNVGSPRAALDFAPPDPQAEACGVSTSWVTAIAPGLVLRAGRGSVLVDLDGDGNEGSGWVVLYLHIAAAERVAPGTWLETNARIGHPSCEGGIATGTHIHLARKYNGEWLPINPDFPWLLSGWQAVAGPPPYRGQMQRGAQVISSNPIGSEKTRLIR